MAGSLVFRNQSLGLPEYRFLLRVIVRSGIGEDSYCPRNFVERREDAPTHQDALDEMDAFFDAAIADLLHRTGIAPGDVDVLVVNVCMFSPGPSLASRIVRRFGMREDVAAYNLSGMGCSAGLVSLDLARNALRARPASVIALVVSTESIAPHWYTGTDRSMMLGNSLFRCGGSAALLTNDPSLGRRAKMALHHLVRANTAAADEAHASAQKRDDGSGRARLPFAGRVRTLVEAFVDFNFELAACSDYSSANSDYSGASSDSEHARASSAASARSSFLDARDTSKALLKLSIPRIKLLRNRRELQLRQMRRDIAKLLEAGQEATTRIRVEHIIREENMMAAQEILELFCELVSVRLPIIEAQKFVTCPALSVSLIQ
ncbi:hypothetical protein ACQ4PT_062820 [Festuca glaucescens]